MPQSSFTPSVSDGDGEPWVYETAMPSIGSGSVLMQTTIVSYPSCSAFSFFTRAVSVEEIDKRCRKTVLNKRMDSDAVTRERHARRSAAN